MLKHPIAAAEVVWVTAYYPLVLRKIKQVSVCAAPAAASPGSWQRHRGNVTAFPSNVGGPSLSLSSGHVPTPPLQFIPNSAWTLMSTPLHPTSPRFSHTTFSGQSPLGLRQFQPTALSPWLVDKTPAQCQQGHSSQQSPWNQFFFLVGEEELLQMVCLPSVPLLHLDFTS